MRGARGRDAAKEQYWARVIAEAARSGKPIREFCRERRLKDSQFYWWQRKLREQRANRALPRGISPKAGNQAGTFALVSEESEQVDAGIELVLADGGRVRINRGVDEHTLRTVLRCLCASARTQAAVGAQGR